MRYNGSGVLLSHLTLLEPKGNRVLESVRVWNFQWYFTLETSFSGILRFCGSLSVIEPIFPSIISFLLYQLYYQIDIEILFDLQLLLEGWTLSNGRALEAMTNSTNIGVGATIFQELSWSLLDLTCAT